MQEKKEVVVILAAGRGSRAGDLTKDTSKCVYDLGDTNPVVHTLRSFEQAGVKDAIVITGYKDSKVRCEINKLLHRFDSGMNVKFVHNQDFDFHGCEYSLSCSADFLSGYNTVYITEGDLIMNPQYVNSIVTSPQPSAGLLRNMSYIIDTKSVVGTGQNGKVSQYVYDSTHHSVLDLIRDSSTIIGDSMQLWKFGGESLQKLVKELHEYKYEADKSKRDSETPLTHNGLYSINRVINSNPLSAIVLKRPDADEWLNLNTREDMTRASGFNWLNRCKERN